MDTRGVKLLPTETCKCTDVWDEYAEIGGAANATRDVERFGGLCCNADGEVCMAVHPLDQPAVNAEKGKQDPRAGPTQNVLRTLPSTAGDRKSVPITTGVIDYFPLAIAEIARLSKAGNDQHNPGQPLHWARGKSSDHADCLVRHLIQRGEEDTDGISHTAKVAWRALALLQEELEAKAGWEPK